MVPRPGARSRLLVGAAAVVSGLGLGLLVIGFAGGAGRQPGEYRPFLAGWQDRLTEAIEEGGPVFYPDPRGGTRAFYLDVEDGMIVALHVVPPGGDASCPVQYGTTEQGYTDCRDRPVDPGGLMRFPVMLQTEGDRAAVFVDPRVPVPPPGGGPVGPGS